MSHSRAAEIGEGQLALGHKRTRPAICEIKGECKALKYLEVLSMLWSTVHLFLVMLFRKMTSEGPQIFCPRPCKLSCQPFLMAASLKLLMIC